MEKFLSLSDLNHLVEICSKYLSAVTGIEDYVQPKDIFISFDEDKLFIKIIMDDGTDDRLSAKFEFERSSNSNKFKLLNVALTL